MVDYAVKIRVKSDNSGVETGNVKLSMNPFDEIALEEAVRLKENKLATEVVAVSIGSHSTKNVLQRALALGADRAIHVVTEYIYEALNIAKILRFISHCEQPQLVLLGKQAIEDDCNQTGQMLAALLNWPQATFASKIVIKAQSVITCCDY